MNCFIENGVAVTVPMSHEEWAEKIARCFGVKQEQLKVTADNEMPIFKLNIDSIHESGELSMTVVDKGISPIVQSFMDETDRLEEKWQECDFGQLDKDISDLYRLAEESISQKLIYIGWAELAKLIGDERIEKLAEQSNVDWSEGSGESNWRSK